METYDNIYESICRLCLCYRDRNKMVSLIDKNNQDGLSHYAKAVSIFARISLHKQDYFPNNMCLNCLSLLKGCIYFKMLTESSNNCLKKLANSVRKDSENLKEKIIEYTMLNFYFPSECFKLSQENCESKKNVFSSKDEGEYNIDVKSQNKVAENQIISNNILDDEICNVSESEAEEDITHNSSKILDKMQDLIGPNLIETTLPLQKLFKKKKNYIKKKKIFAKQQYKLAKQRQKLHYRHKLQSKSLVCSVCNKVLANQMTYDHHMQRHNGCRYICEHCGKGFPVLTELNVHQVTRHGTGPHHQCSHCPFKAARRFDLIEHERIHTGERPYTCEKCGLTFRRRGIWRKHLIYHTEKKIQCPQCPRKFYQRSEMLAHANNIHERVYVYLCSKCGTTYAKIATVRRHMTERHGIPREMQGKIIRINKGASYQEQ